MDNWEMKKLNNIMLIDDNIHSNYFNEIKLEQNNACDKITIFMNGKEALDYLEILYATREGRENIKYICEKYGIEKKQITKLKLKV